MKKLVALLTIFVFSIAALTYAFAHASYTKRTMMSGSQGCGGCHASLNTAVQVAISGPDTLSAGATGTFQVKISGGSGTAVCVDIAASGGTLAPADANTKASQGELITNGVKRYSGGSYTYSFSLTAPTTSQTLTLYATGMSTMQTYNFAPNKSVVVTSATTGVQEPALSAPVTVLLEQNFPNPFNPSTAITYTLSQRGTVRLAIYDGSGAEVALLEEGIRESGSHLLQWNAAGSPSGLYFCRLETRTADGSSVTQVRKMILQK